MNPDLLNHRTNSWLFGVGRLKAGVTVEQARAHLDTLVHTFAQTLASNGPPPRHSAAVVPVDVGNAAQRQQMGIRLALGATTRDVFALVVRDGMQLVAVGIAIGLAAGLLAARSLSTFLFGVTSSDVPTFIVTTMLLALVALGACAIPARRAMRVQPIVALRQE